MVSLRVFGSWGAQLDNKRPIVYKTINLLFSKVKMEQGEMETLGNEDYLVWGI